MKKFVVDTHTHSIVSGHAYSTLMENIKVAAKKGIKVLATTEHGPKLVGAPHESYFGNMRVLPRVIDGVTILRGCEVNIMNSNGDIDISEWVQENLDLVIASLHQSCIKPSTKEENTRALLNVMENPNVHIIGHTGNPAYPIYEEEVVKKAKEKDILIEINNSSFVRSRTGSAPNCIKIAKLCKDYGVRMAAGTDSHFCSHIGDFEEVRKVLEAIKMPDELIINTKEDKIIRYLKGKGKLKDISIDKSTQYTYTYNDKKYLSNI
ncbi:phosphatase [Hathewaya histolytica]|uniref:Hydrolase n=1 Tax=Hathewaya histolytica TaxID=1498 RepID=A0A4U9QZ21_HATHI|nr:phosphatase [Hathewaya histolytica]VTQ83849.1 hydrolase [Hathewaya histolytica]